MISFLHIWHLSFQNVPIVTLFHPTSPFSSWNFLPDYRYIIEILILENCIKGNNVSDLAQSRDVAKRVCGTLIKKPKLYFPHPE
jgi:hypothetical protein